MLSRIGRTSVLLALVVAPAITGAQAPQRPRQSGQPATAGEVRGMRELRGDRGARRQRLQRGVQAKRMMQARAAQLSVSRILDARRALDLSPRQVAQLDSIERLQVADRKAFGERMRGEREKFRGQVAQLRADPAARDSMRARMQQMRPQLEARRKADSGFVAAAERVLNDSQRAKVRELRAEARGRMQGLQAGRRMHGGAQMRGHPHPRGGERMRREMPMPGRP